MTELGEAYLALVILAFLSFSGTMFWAMMTSNSRVRIRQRKRPDTRRPEP